MGPGKVGSAIVLATSAHEDPLSWSNVVCLSRTPSSSNSLIGDSIAFRHRRIESLSVFHRSVVRSINRSLGGTSLTGLLELMSSSSCVFPSSGSSDDPMGGQSTEPRLFLSDKNVRGRINGGREKSSDREGGRRWHKFSDPFSENHKKTYS